MARRVRQSIEPNFRHCYKSALPYLTLAIWLIPLLFLSNGHQSVLPHDEGLYAGRARLMVETGDWINPWAEPHHKTPGIYWLIAGFYQLLGVNLTAARLPSQIAAVLCAGLLYAIGKKIFNSQVGWLAAIILSVEVLWLQFQRLAGPDPWMILLVLFAIWNLLQAEESRAKSDLSQPLQLIQSRKAQRLYALLAGMSLGLCILVRGFSVVAAIAALVPYFIHQHRRHRHLLNPFLYLGFAIGSLPTLAWVAASYQRFGLESIYTLFGLVKRLGTNQRGDNNLFYYFWNVPINTFPWVFFALIGLWLLLRSPVPRYQALVVGFPLVFFCTICLFSTRLPHYALLLYPFISLGASVALCQLGTTKPNPTLLVQSISISQPIKVSKMLPKRLIRGLFILEWGLFCLLMLGGIAVCLFLPDPGTAKYGLIAIAAGLGGLTPLLLGLFHIPVLRKWELKPWAVAWLTACWLALATTGASGLMGDYSPEVRQFLQQPDVAQVLNAHPINFVNNVDGKTRVLLKFYTPHWGKDFRTIDQVPSGSYTWFCPKVSRLAATDQVIGTVRGCELLRKL
jgi:4-amino-4-deoxy-L-arabinose transferase-like glycosyltransferase